MKLIRKVGIVALALMLMGCSTSIEQDNTNKELPVVKEEVATVKADNTHVIGYVIEMSEEDILLETEEFGITRITYQEKPKALVETGDLVEFTLMRKYEKESNLEFLSGDDLVRLDKSKAWMRVERSVLSDELLLSYKIEPTNIDSFYYGGYQIIKKDLSFFASATGEMKQVNGFIEETVDLSPLEEANGKLEKGCYYLMFELFDSMEASKPIGKVWTSFEIVDQLVREDTFLIEEIKDDYLLATYGTPERKYKGKTFKIYTELNGKINELTNEPFKEFDRILVQSDKTSWNEVDSKNFELTAIEVEPVAGLGAAAKPVIYLYPEEKMNFKVSLDLDGQLTTTYPEYRDGWEGVADVDGTLHLDGHEYSYLFWEGIDNNVYDFSKGFVVKGSESATFLQETLSKMGLLPKEYNEFIVYWLPLLQANEYNLITFQQETYTDYARLHIEPKPDSLLRVYMVYKPLLAPKQIEPQVFEPFIREGFTVVEWGGYGYLK